MNPIAGVPEIGSWYRHLDKGETFQVVGYDSRSDTIEIQSLNGDLDEIDCVDWDELLLARAAPPEDWRGPMDEVAADDLGDSDYEPPLLHGPQPPQPLGAEVWDDTR